VIERVRSVTGMFTKIMRAIGSLLGWRLSV